MVIIYCSCKSSLFNTSNHSVTIPRRNLCTRIPPRSNWVLPPKNPPFQLKCVPIILTRTDGISYQNLGITTNQLSAASNQGDSRFPWNSMRWSLDDSRRRRRRVDPPDLIKRSLCVVKCRPLFHSMMVAISNTTLLLHCCLRTLSRLLCIRPQINKNIK